MKSYKKLSIGKHLELLNKFEVKLDKAQTRMMSLKQKNKKIEARKKVNTLWRLKAQCHNKLLRRIPSDCIIVSDINISTNSFNMSHTKKIIFV